MVGVIVLFAVIMSVVINFLEKKAGFRDENEMRMDKNEAGKLPTVVNES
jgi:hypothetical protein